MKVSQNMLPYFARILVVVNASNMLSSVGTIQSPITLGVGSSSCRSRDFYQSLPRSLVPGNCDGLLGHFKEEILNYLPSFVSGRCAVRISSAASRKRNLKRLFERTLWCVQVGMYLFGYFCWFVT